MSVEILKAKTIFRENAIKNLHSRDDTHNVFKVVTASSWLWIFVSLVLLMGVFIWGMFGRITITTPASGIILLSTQFQHSEERIKESYSVRKERMNSLKYLWEKKQHLFNNHYLTIVELNKAKEEYNTAKEEFEKLENLEYITFRKVSNTDKPNAQSLDALVFINHTMGKRIGTDMLVYLLPTMLSPYEYGYIKGRVISVSEYPVSKQMVSSYLQNINWVDEFFSEGAPFIAKIRLEENSSTKSGLAWTTKEGAPFKIKYGTSVTVKIVNKSCAPFQLLSKFSNCH